MVKTFMAIRSGCQEIKTPKTKPRIQKLGGGISRSATNGTASSHHQQQQSQLYQQLAEHEGHYAETMTNKRNQETK
jgi:hypothetical protein